MHFRSLSCTSEVRYLPLDLCRFGWTNQAPQIKSPLNRDFCAFETLTMVPIQQKLIDASLLTPEEVQWLNAYHKDVHDKLQPLLEDDPEACAYLARETKPLPQ